ncbi:trypsin-1-like [Plectropomus leopardus]|uniref:trypsin-1-like n=1 Tax=Plectropomus leopardus TaxID=160734 RepID=UPI001C4BEE80|nr:trypsin-1-like [Plectropomus leopardus]
MTTLWVTAARCMKDMKGKVKVVLGTHDLKSLMHTSKYILEKCKHPSYESSDKGYDIMLLKVGGEEGMNVPITTINLSENKIPKNKNCCVAGWGCTKDGGSHSDELKVINVSINNLKICKTKKWPGLHASCASGYTTKKHFVRVILAVL